jgi:integrative and conjugative element protein (TIGR02256 family)
VADQLILPPSVRAATAHVRAGPGTETGGVLLGRRRACGTLEITFASGPGRRAVRRKHYFLRDREFLQQAVDREVASADGAVDYVGEWHVHRASDAPPSFTDRRSLWRIARQQNYPTESPVLIIVESANDELRFRAYEFVVSPKRTSRELAIVGRHAYERSAPVIPTPAIRILT